ncbi:MAG: hypothetical protein IT473_01035 [Lysobacter sp.]|nr:hypothetical protein [Lysobacter sp.]
MSAVATHLSAEDIGRRVLKLIDSIRSAEDLAPEHIEQIIGIHVEHNDEDPNIYGFGGTLSDDWTYSLVSTPDKLGEKPASMRFTLSPATSNLDQYSPTCKMSFDDYVQALVASGFSSRPMGAFPGSDAIYLNRGEIGVIAYSDKSPNVQAQAKTACLSKLIISAYA